MGLMHTPRQIDRLTFFRGWVFLYESTGLFRRVKAFTFRHHRVQVLFSIVVVDNRPTHLTLATYHEMGRLLLTISSKWGLPPMEWGPSELHKDGMNYHMPEAQRIIIYKTLKRIIHKAWNQAKHCLFSRIEFQFFAICYFFPTLFSKSYPIVRITIC